MNIVCPTCNKAYRIRDERLSAPRARATCRNCGGVIVVESSGLVRAEEQKRSLPSQGPKAAYSGDTGSDQDILATYPKLREIPSSRVALREILAPNKKGSYKTRRNTLKVKILMAVSQVLDRALRDGERVFRIGKGTAYYPAELLFGNGWLTMMYNNYAILATDQRILCININSRMKRTTHYIFQILYGDIKKIKRGLLGTLSFVRKSSKRRVFTNVSRLISGDLRDFIRERADSLPDKPEKVFENICPACFAPLEKGLLSCPACKARFKEPRKASLRSLLLPGLGDMYLGHRALGALELGGSVLVWTYVVMLILSGQREGLFVALFLLIFYNGMDGMLTLFMAKKGYMLA